ncbi:uncharacterized protein [Medicago truncatula]|uniref:uncharacterized protein n=1 Tax=Medicago truncatula TaxID=3880 RepID=UPI00023625B0|nr:uncharacterized protein LOC112419788 [Medicago truncatula]
MESSASSISELPSNQRKGQSSRAPLMTIESNRPSFLAVCTEIICELDPLFVAEYFDELQEQWMLQDGIGNCHQVEFNKILTIPILTTGWHQFRDFYHITLNPLMSFTYLGHSVFQIKIFDGSTPKNEYPRYHRLTTCITRDLTYQLTVPENSIVSSKLILPTDLGNFLQAKNHEYLRLCGTANNVTICKLLFINDPQTNTTIVIIGSGWRRFCLSNRIAPGTLLEFKCDSVMAKNIIIVFRLTRQY